MQRDLNLSIIQIKLDKCIFMAKKSVIERQRRREKLVKKYQEKRKSLKEKILYSKSFKDKLTIYSELQDLPRDSSKSRLVRLM